MKSRQFIVDERKGSLSVRIPERLIQECRDIASAMTWEARDRVAEDERDNVKEITSSDVVRNAIEHGLEVLRQATDDGHRPVLPRIVVGPYGRMPAAALDALVERQPRPYEESFDGAACEEELARLLLHSTAAKDHQGHQEWLWTATVDELLDWTSEASEAERSERAERAAWSQPEQNLPACLRRDASDDDDE